ncbi:hypothetical protein V8F06_002448 [Rhypophila decipiens]
MNEMATDTLDDILSRAAKDGSMNYASWPELLPALLSRIDHIARNRFPIPRVPAPRPPARAPSPRTVAPLTSSDPVEAPGSSGTTPSSQETNKENANPSPFSARIAVSNAIPAASTAISASGNPSVQQEGTAPGSLPPQIDALLNEITSTLRVEFVNYPPHTIQRLSELLLNPQQHYRNLVAYLHALDRVVHVTSGANTYPLPPAVSDMSSMSGGCSSVGTSNTSGLTINSSLANNIGSDEALGGALLTPIPWLKKSTNGNTGDDLSDPGGSSPPSINPTHAQQRAQPSQLQPQAGAASRNREPQLRTESTETIEGPNGRGSIETVTITRAGLLSRGSDTALANRGLVQGADIFRQDQRADSAAKSPQQEQETTHASSATGTEDDQDSTMTEGDCPEDEKPYAGPEEIGPEDTGPQLPTQSRSTHGPDGAAEVQGIDVEAAVGRKASTPEEAIPKGPKHEATDKLESPAKRRESEGEEGLAKSSFENTEERPKDSEDGSAVENLANTSKPAPSDSSAVEEEAAPQSGEKMDSDEPQPEQAKSNTEEDKVDEPMTDIKSEEEEGRGSNEPAQEPAEVDHSDAILGQPNVAE